LKDLDLLEIGEITKLIGIGGRLKAVSFVESPRIFESLQDVYIQGKDHVLDRYLVSTVSSTRKSFSIKLEGIDNPETAGRLVGCRVLIPSERLEKLPDGEYYWKDIIGLEVRTVDGERLGNIDHIIETGSNDVYVCTGGEREILLPAIEDVIKTIDLEKRFMIVELLEGL